MSFVTTEPAPITELSPMVKTYHLKENKSNYEIHVMSALLELISKLTEREPAAEDFKSESSWLDAHRKMVAYISSHFDDEISLNDISGSASVSRATCCRIFKKFDQLSPIEFLTIYRLNVSADLLTRTDESISLIAGKCGFNSVSYYSKLFLEHYGCQPHKYRNISL
jgi:AraC-like DNA-binding protein